MKYTGWAALFFTILLYCMLMPVHECLAINFSDFSSTVNKNLSGGPFNGDEMAAFVGSAAIIVLIILGFKYARKQETESIDQHYDIVKKRHEQYLTASRTGQSQKRQWFRLKTRAEFEWLPPRRPAQVKRPRYKRDILTDISAGGLGFVTTELLEAGDEIKIILYPNNGGPIYLDGRVVRVVPDEKDEGISSSVGICFENIRESDRDRITSWLLTRQRTAIKEEKSIEPVHFPSDNDMDI